MLNRAEQVLNRLSHQKSVEIGSLTGRMVAMENPQTTANLNRVFCQAGLLYQQERRLDDVHLGAYIKRMMENRLNDDPEEQPTECVMVHRQLSLLSFQTLIRLKALQASLDDCKTLASEVEHKKDHLNKMLERLDAAQKRHEQLAKLDELAGSISSSHPSTREVAQQISQLEVKHEQSNARLDFVRSIADSIDQEASELIGKVAASVAQLHSLLEKIQDEEMAP